MHDDVRDMLAENGIRATPQRVVVLAALMQERWDTSAQRLHEKLRIENPQLGLATVYRTLESLSAAGLVHQLNHGQQVCYRYCQPGHHHHLTCSGCHRVVELRGCGIGEWASRQADEHGFHDVEHSVELVGICDSCASRR